MQQSKSVAFLLGASCLFSGLFLTGCGGGGTSTPALGNNFLFECFKLKSDVSYDTGNEVGGKIFALKSQCLRDNVPVIASLSGGLTESWERKFHGQYYTHGYVATFQSEEDRLFYEKCTARDDFAKFLSPLIADVVSHDMLRARNPGYMVFDYMTWDWSGWAASDLDTDKVVRMVSFRFKEGIASDTQNDVMARFLALKDQCLTDGRPIVETLVGGDATSARSSADQLFSQGYYIQFASKHDWEIFAGCLETPCQLGGKPEGSSYCEAHDDFKVYADGFLESEQVIEERSSAIPALNYNPGRFLLNFISEETAEIVA